MLLFVPCFLFLIRVSTELRRTGPVVLFWFFHTIDLKKCVIAINTLYFRSFACVKNTIKRTAPRRSRTLARSVRRVIACQSRASVHPGLSGGSVEKKNSASYWPEPSRSNCGFGSLGSAAFLRTGGRRRAGVSLLRVGRLAGTRQAPLPHLYVARHTVCVSDAQSPYRAAGSLFDSHMITLNC